MPLTSAPLLLERASCASRSPALRSAIRRIVELECAGLFETLVFEPGQRLCDFDDPPTLWIVACGSVRLSRRSELGRSLRATEASPGTAFGHYPGVAIREWPPPVRFAGRAMDRVEILRLRGAPFPAGIERAPELVARFQFLDAQLRATEVVETDVRKLPGFAFARPSTAGDLLAAGDEVRVTESTTLLELGQPTDRAYVLLDGDATVVRLDGYGRPHSRRLGVGEPVGVLPALAQLPSMERLVAEPGALLTAIRREVFVETLARNPVTRRSLPVPVPAGVVDLILVGTDAPGGLPAALTTVLASVAAAFGDVVAIFRLVAGDAREPWTDKGEGVEGEGLPLPFKGTDVLRVEVSAPAPEDVPAALHRAITAVRTHLRSVDLLFLHPEAPSAAHIAAAAPVISRVAWLTSDPTSRPPGPLRDRPVELAGLLGKPGVARPPIWPPGAPRLRLDWGEVRTLAARAEAKGLELTFGGRGGDIVERAAFESLSRWARSLTNRLVGLALGGGGSPGFAHIALIRSLERLGVPIDLVAGTSFGSLVGAWYSGVRQLGIAEPMRLQSLVEAGPRLNKLNALGFFDSRPMADYIDERFGGLLLGDLEVPFYPVSGEIDSGTTFIGHSESLGECVRMSGAFPGLFPPVIKDLSTRLVDGGFVNNVPASVLRLEGATHVLASNSIGLIPPRTPPRVAGKVGRWLAGVNPFGRVEDVLRGALLLFHRVGDSESDAAEYVFESRYTGFQFWDFSRGDTIIAATQPSADAFARHLQEVLVRARKGLPQG